MNRKIPVSICITLVLIAMTVTFSVTMIGAMRLFDSTVSSVNDMQAEYSHLAELDRYVRANEYYDIDDATLTDMISSGYALGTGDPYARYYTAAQYSALLATQNGTLVGIGADLAPDPSSSYARITRVYADSPASDIGLVAGGYISMIGDAEARTFTTAEALRTALRGESGTTVTIHYIAPDHTEADYELTRRNYTVPTVSSKALGKGGYIAVTDITDATPSDFSYAVNRLLAAGAGYFVIDLRGASSTNLDAAISCVDVLAPAGEVAWSLSKDGQAELLGTSDANAVSVPVVFVVNGGTANAAELLASAAQHMGGARIVGEATAGKSVVMGPISRMSDGSAIQVTQAGLLSADGQSFEKGLDVDNLVALGADEAALAGDTAETSDSQIKEAARVAENMVAAAAGAN